MCVWTPLPVAQRAKRSGRASDQGLSVAGQREPVQNQGQEIVGNHCGQVPLELPQDQHLLILEAEEEGGVSG